MRQLPQAPAAMTFSMAAMDVSSLQVNPFSLKKKKVERSPMFLGR